MLETRPGNSVQKGQNSGSEHGQSVSLSSSSSDQQQQISRPPKKQQASQTMQRCWSPLRVRVGQGSCKRAASPDVEVSSQNAFGVKTHHDTMFLCTDCGKAFNSHSPFADHIFKSEEHRRMTRREHFFAEDDDDFTPCFVCVCCCSVSLNPSQLFDHLKCPSHVHNSLDQVLTWYENQPYGLSKDRFEIEARHHRGIRKLERVLTNVYYFDLK